MERTAEERREMRERVIREVKVFAKSLREVLGSITVVLVGSYARGDFNEWSDIDLLIIVAEADPNPLKRYDKILDLLVKYSLPIEPIIVTKGEFLKGLKKKNPLFMEAIKLGVILCDDLKLLTTDHSRMLYTNGTNTCHKRSVYYNEQ